MNNVLFLKNCPVVYLSYLLNHFMGNYRDSVGASKWVLAHSHAVDNVASLNYVDYVLPYRGASVLEFSGLQSDVQDQLLQNEFDVVYFFMQPGQKSGFENLLNIARKVVKKNGKVIGMTLKGEEVVFSPWMIRRVQYRLWFVSLVSILVLLMLLVCVPFIILISFLRIRFSYKMIYNKGAHNEYQ